MHLPTSFAVLALRMWWPVVALGAVLGIAAGIVAAASAPYRATTLLRVDTSTNPVQSVQIVSTALSLVDSDPVFIKAIGNGSESLGELRERTSVGIQDLGEILTVSVVAPTPEQAVRDTDRFATAAADFLRERARRQFETLTVQGQAALNDGVLQDLGAEEFRRQRIGVDFADAQGLALRSAQLVTKVDNVQDPVRLGLSTKMGVAVGAAGGAVAGYAAALVLGVRRRRIRHLSDLRAMPTKVRAYGPPDHVDGLARVAIRCATLDRPLLAVLAMPGSERHLPGVAAAMRQRLAHEGLRWVAVDADDLGTLSSKGRRLRPEGSEPAQLAAGNGIVGGTGADMILATGVADRTAVNRAAARADVVVLVAAYRRTRLGELAEVIGELAELSPTLIMTSVEASATPDAPDSPPHAPVHANGHVTPSGNTERPAGTADAVPASLPAWRPSPRPRMGAQDTPGSDAPATQNPAAQNPAAQNPAAQAPASDARDADPTGDPEVTQSP